jgi:hypothetical protein
MDSPIPAAIQKASSLRPVINPIGRLPDLLVGFAEAHQQAKK